jgi:acetyl/propionyl-CoA carboxylase alpha subunit
MTSLLENGTVEWLVEQCQRKICMKYMVFFEYDVQYQYQHITALIVGIDL